MATSGIDLPGLPGAAAPIRGYKFMISGKPFNSLAAFIPVVFETTILLSAFGAVFGMFGLNRLPRLNHPLFKHSTFLRVSDDRFYLSVEATDPKFNQTATVEMLQSIGGKNVELVED